MKPNKEQLFYFDCEWVRVSDKLEDLKTDFPLLYDAFLHQCEKWNLKNSKDLKPSRSNEDYWIIESHFYPEFCKIICVSYGFFSNGVFEIKSVYGNDEHQLLSALPKLFERVDKLGWKLCGYGIKRFDMPFLSKRMMANGIVPPSNINVYGKKPWEVEVFDLPEVWGQGNIQESYTPFELACAALGIESSKGDLSGSKVGDAYRRGEIEKIKEYCEKDVLKTMELASKLLDLTI